MPSLGRLQLRIRPRTLTVVLSEDLGPGRSLDLCDSRTQGPTLSQVTVAGRRERKHRTRAHPLWLLAEVRDSAARLLPDREDHEGFPWPGALRCSPCFCRPGQGSGSRAGQQGLKARVLLFCQHDAGSRERPVPRTASLGKRGFGRHRVPTEVVSGWSTLEEGRAALLACRSCGTRGRVFRLSLCQALGQHSLHEDKQVLLAA